MGDGPLHIEIDEDRFLTAAYEPTLEMLAAQVPTTSEELVPGDARTRIRLFNAGLPAFKLLALETICVVLETHPEGPARTAALKEAVGDWEPTWRALPPLGEASIGLDGQGLRLDMTVLESHWR